MTPSLLLRIAAGCYAFFALGHTVGMLAPSERGADEQAVFDAMRGYSFDLFGTLRTHWDLYVGEGWYLTVFAAMFAALCWQLSGLVARWPREARALVPTLFAASVFSALLNWGFFFAVPAVTSTLGSMALLLAVIGLYRDEPARRPTLVQ
jgi:hypothetical protein